MKGTLYSADFIKDSDSNLRLLELNTDTGFIKNTLSSRFDFTDFITILSSNNITELVLIYKKHAQLFISALETVIGNDATFITTITKQVESTDSIYPTAVTDSAEKFILRLAYDENALFDSTYCKQRANVQKLFFTNSATGSIPEFYHSGSDYLANTLRSAVNDHDTLPDFSVKAKTEAHSPLKFINLGNSDSSSADRISDYIDNYHNSETHTFEKYHYNNSEVTEDGKVSGIRVIGIVYGTDISNVVIGKWKVKSFLNIPTTSEVDYLSDSDIVTEYNNKHYFQLTSNWLRTSFANALYVDSTIIDTADEGVAIQTLSEGESIKSIFLNGLPDSDDMDVFGAWTSDGSDFPSGSFLSSSVVNSNVLMDASREYGVVGEIKVHSDENIYSSVGKHFLVYSTGSDAISFKTQYDIRKEEDFLIDPSGSLIPIISNKIAILENNETGSLYTLNVETLDTFFVSSSQQPFIVHNACFPAGTLIRLTDGTDIGIEDIKIGDSVLSYNGKTSPSSYTNELQESKEVYGIQTPIHDDLVKYTFDDGTTVISTFDHPYFVNDGLSSFKPEWTTTRYKLDETINQIKINDLVFHVDGNVLTITNIEIQPEVATQTYLLSVKDNPNFYANGILVHNKQFFTPPCCFIAGTEITLANGDSKNIEDIIVGDEVIGWKDGERSNSIVSELKPTILGDRNLYNINDLKITFTDEHPFLTKDGWKSIKPDNGTEYGLLVIGDEVNYQGDWIVINELNEVQEDNNYNTPVYNFTVKDIHSYIADGIIVHNK